MLSVEDALRAAKRSVCRDVLKGALSPFKLHEVWIDGVLVANIEVEILSDWWSYRTESDICAFVHLTSEARRMLSLPWGNPDL